MTNSDDLSQEPMENLRAMADGCREFTCPEHGRINEEIVRRSTQHPSAIVRNATKPTEYEEQS